MSARKRRVKAAKRAAWVIQLRDKWDKRLGRIEK